jgi:PTS system fructose-specific IIC component
MSALMGNPLGFLVAVVAGTLVATALVVALKTFARRRPSTPGAEDTTATAVTERETAGATA